MGFLVSPGVEVKEIDLTNVIPAVSTSIGGFVGEFRWGPVGEAVTVSSEKELALYYGTPTETLAQSFITAASFLKYGNTLKVSRALRSDANNAANWNPESDQTVNGIQIGNKSDFLAATDFKGANFVARYPGSIGSSLSVIVLDYFGYDTALASSDLTLQSIAKSFNYKPDTSTSYSTIKGSTTGRDEIHIAIIDKDGLFTGTKGSVLEVWPGLSLRTDAKKEDGSSLYYKDVLNDNSSYIWAVSLSSIYYNADVTIASANGVTRKTGTVVSPGQTASLVRLGSNGSGFFVNTNTVGVNNQGFRFKLSDDGAAAASNDPVDVYVASDGIEITIYYGSTGSVWPTASVLNSALATAMNQGGASSYTVTFVQGTGSVSSALRSLIGSVDNVFTPTYYLTGGSNPVIQSSTSAIQIDFVDSYGGQLDGGSTIQYRTAAQVFRDPELIDVNLLFTSANGSTSLSDGESALIEIAIARKDCVAFISAPLTVATQTSDNSRLAAVKAKFQDSSATRSSYIVWDSTPLYVYNKYADKYLWIPACGHIAGLCANTDNVAEPWFSPAGYNRGNLLGVTKLAYNPKQADRDELYKLGVNPIVAFPGQGILLFGDKTAQAKPSAFDRINVRRLFITLEKAISTAAKYQLFELNDEFTRAMFRNMVEPFLREVKGRRGVTDFLVICDETNNTGEVIDTNRFVADIYIKPARSINFISLNFIATRTGVEFSEIVGK